ncbi:MAG: hypothetical protein WBC22_13025, partial [Sedimentisphaerales bacterium]
AGLFKEAGTTDETFSTYSNWSDIPKFIENNKPGFPCVFIYPTGYIPAKFRWKYYEILLYCLCNVFSPRTN